MTYIAISLLLLFSGPASAQTPGTATVSDMGISTAGIAGLAASATSYSETLSTAVPEINEEDVTEAEEGEGSGEDIFVDTTTIEPPMPVKLGGNGRLTITRKDTGEKITINYRMKDGGYDLAELAKFNHIARCSLTGAEKTMAIKLVELLDAVEDHFGKRGILLMSGYRSLKLNRMVPGAAEHSLHMLGWAADIRIPGYSSTAVKKYALKLGAGGVGYYPSMGFTHLDVGKIRYWAVKRHVRARKRPHRAAPVRGKGKTVVPALKKSGAKPPVRKK